MHLCVPLKCLGIEVLANRGQLKDAYVWFDWFSIPQIDVKSAENSEMRTDVLQSVSCPSFPRRCRMMSMGRNCPKPGEVLTGLYLKTVMKREIEVLQVKMVMMMMMMMMMMLLMLLLMMMTTTMTMTMMMTMMPMVTMMMMMMMMILAEHCL